MKRFLLWAAVVVLSAAAWGAEVIVAPAASGTSRDGYDAALELKYDSGKLQYYTTWISGANAWAGNDFDISSISAYRAVVRVRLYSTAVWPNARWDGFRVGIYSYAGGTAGSLLWGPKYFKPSQTISGWCNCSVGWTLPSGNDEFVAAAEQYYNYPDVDPFGVDDNAVFHGHSWQYLGGRWQAYAGNGGYRNLMLRVVVNNVPVNITPTSVGRVKALYY